MHYSSILIPAGVTVQFTGTAPAVVECDGDCIVHGTLSAAAFGSTDGPGAGNLSIGSPGAYCFGFGCGSFGCACPGYSVNPGSGRHHGIYGSAIPFSLLGGSQGGSTTFSSSTVFNCCINPTWYAGGGGGGTLAVIAEGVIDIDGIIDVSGGQYVSAGSAGSILLRGKGGVVLRASGQVLAGPAAATYPASNGGEVRLDAWGSPPVVQGSIVAPAPVVLTLPYLHAPSAPTIGTTWSVDVFAPSNSAVFLAASTQPMVSTPTPFGSLEIDLAFGDGVGVSVTTTGHDPRATVAWAVPNVPQAVGLSIWVQGFAWPVTLAARLTNAISRTVQ